MDLDERKFKILQAIIDDYITTAMPVGSRTISRKEGMGLSSATIRNEMSDLEELGYLASPHTSAGRVPSWRAYRLYVDQILRVSALPPSEYSLLRKIFSSRMGQMEDVLSSATQALSAMTDYTSVMIAPQIRSIARIQLVPLTDTTALMVTVTDEGVHKDSVIPYPAGVTPDHLYAISNLLTERLAGKRVSEYPKVMQELGKEMSGQRELFTRLMDSPAKADGAGRALRARGRRGPDALSSRVQRPEEGAQPALHPGDAGEIGKAAAAALGCGVLGGHWAGALGGGHAGLLPGHGFLPRGHGGRHHGHHRPDAHALRPRDLRAGSHEKRDE